MSKHKLTDKQKAFAHHYIATRNPKKSAIVAGYNEKSASISAYDNKQNPAVRAYMMELLAGSGLTLDTVLQTHKRNMLQDKHLPTSQRAVADYYELTGMKDTPQNGNNVNIAFIIEDDSK